MALTLPFTSTNGRGNKAYDRVVATYENSTPATGKVAREIETNSDDMINVDVQQPD